MPSVTGAVARDRRGSRSPALRTPSGRAPGVVAVNRCPNPALIGIGPSRGRAATSPAVNRPSAHAGTSCTQSTSGSSAVASRIISPRNPARCGGTVFPWKRFQLRTSTRLSYFDARSACRSARVHAVVRPRAGGGSRSRRCRGRASDVELPLRRDPGRRRLSPQRTVVSTVVATLQALSVATASEGGRTSRCDALTLVRPRRRLAPTVARAPTGGRAPAFSVAGRVHRSRPAAPANSVAHRALAEAPGSLRPGRRAHRAGSRDTGRARASTHG